MERLTLKEKDWCWKNEEFWLSAENPTLEEADNVYYKLAEFEDFMQEQNIKDLDLLKSIIELGKKDRQTMQKYLFMWQKLKEFVYQDTALAKKCQSNSQASRMTQANKIYTKIQ